MNKDYVQLCWLAGIILIEVKNELSFDLAYNYLVSFQTRKSLDLYPYYF